MATLSTETNTFSPVPTTYADYQAYFTRHGTATSEPANLMTEALHLWRARASALGWRVTESLTAIAEPAGKTTTAAHHALRQEILEDLQNAGAPDVILLQLHGAMIAEGEEDCEGDLVAAIRALAPQAVIGVSLDLHCHLRPQLLEAADLIVTFREYPHDDAAPRADELFTLAQRTAQGEIVPHMALFDCRMIALFLTKTPAMRAVVDMLEQAEDTPGVLHASFAHGFPWADIPEVGARTLVITDGDPALATREAARLGRAIYAQRQAIALPYAALDPALDDVAADPNGPITLADMSDNSGAGAPGDATYVLDAVLRRGMTNVALALFWDPAAVADCIAAGTGAQITLPLGGKVEEMSGKPVPVTGTVQAIKTGLMQHLGPALEPLGQMVWLRLPGEVDLVINDLRIQVYHPEVFTQMGIDLTAKHLIVVKSLFHFYSPFAAISQRVIFCASPGRVNPNTQHIPYTRLTAPFWPLHPDPLADADH